MLPRTVVFICLVPILFCKKSAGSGACQTNPNQVQICAPVSSFSSLTGDIGGAFSQFTGSSSRNRGKAGPKGEKGSRGAIGPARETVCRCHAELERQENELQQLKYGCPIVVYNFPRANQVTDYIRYRSYVPRLAEATICMWFRTSSFSNDCLLSYSTSDSRSNEMIIMLEGSTVIDFYLANSRAKLFSFSSPTMTNKWTHMCIWFSSQTSQVGMYINGTSVGSSPYHGGELRGGGSLIFGQEQDRVNAGGLVASQAFSGQIVSPIMWPRVLNQSEIYDVTRRCLCPRDQVMAMTIDKMELHGATAYSMSNCITV